MRKVWLVEVELVQGWQECCVQQVDLLQTCRVAWDCFKLFLRLIWQMPLDFGETQQVRFDVASCPEIAVDF